ESRGGFFVPVSPSSAGGSVQAIRHHLMRPSKHLGCGRLPANLLSPQESSILAMSGLGHLRPYATSSATGCRAPFADLPALAPELGGSTRIWSGDRRWASSRARRRQHWQERDRLHP